jgi:hypothetical protein
MPNPECKYCNGQGGWQNDTGAPMPEGGGFYTAWEVCPSCAHFDLKIQYDGRMKELRQSQEDAKHLAAALHESRNKLLEVQTFVGYVSTCEIRNQPEWMEGLAKRLNYLLETLGHVDRVKFDGRRLILETKG